jgi:hypothetical protein
MIRNRIVLKAFAVFFILQMLTSTVLPTVSWALTAGPTAPEATSFEPVDTTDLVNLASGDLAYNIPLLEVPGPSGGYPLSLSYHAGIQPNEDASWVGLGWTLNPGAVTRNVNGIPDDFFNVENATRYYWDGGRRESFNIGVTVGPFGQSGVTAGLSYSQDTFQGSGVGTTLGVSYGFKSTGIGVSADIGISPFGEPSASVGAGLSIQLDKGTAGPSLGLGVGLSTNFKSVSGNMSAGISYGRYNQTKSDPGRDWSLIGGSIATSGRSSISLGGASITQSNNKMGRVSTSTDGFQFSIPVLPVLGISLGYQYQRYWIDETDKILANGALINAPDNPSKEYLDGHSFDNYSLSDVDSLFSDTQDPEKQLGGTFPNYDNFYVHAQGVSGAMRPYYFQKYLVKRNDFVEKEDEDGDEYKEYKMIQYALGNNSKRAEFRFVGELSNRFEYTPAQTRMAPEAGYNPSNPMAFDFAWNPNVTKGESGNEPYNSNVLPGSRHIEYLTNRDIQDRVQRVNDAGFIETTSSGFIRQDHPIDGIGAMIITNETGVRYHFALPVLTYDEYSYTENNSKVLTFNESKNPYPYAYTWLLTGVTGADYVDRSANGSPDGKLNEYDWGYWVSFEYGKWTEQYYWRNPSEEMKLDIDNQFKKFSEGRKQLYYLDAIRTKTHTALFVKEIRDDAKSTVYAYRDISNLKPGFLHKGTKETLTEVSKKGGFIPQKIRNTCNVETFFDETLDKGYIDYYSRPTSTLKLNEVLLFNNDQLNAVIDKSNGSSTRQFYQYNWTVQKNSECPCCPFTPVTFNQHLYQYVLDIHDVNALPSTFRENALRVIDFATDYSLCPNTANSYSSALANVNEPSSDPSQYPLKGKLTLKKLTFKGKGGADLIPGMTFGYEPGNSLSGSGSITLTNGVYYLSHNNSGLVAGDIIKFLVGSTLYYAVVESTTQYSNKLKILGATPQTVGAINWFVTKNPPYDKDAEDIWGLYKSDIDKALLVQNDNAARLVSPQSARGTDVWSLRTIKSNLGSVTEIDYEPDAYQRPELMTNQVLRAEAVRPKTGSSNYEIVIYDPFKDLDKFVRPNSFLNYTFFIAQMEEADGPWDVDFYRFIPEIKTGTIQVLSMSYTNSKWIIETTSLSSLFKKLPNHGDIYYEEKPLFIGGNLSLDNDFDSFGGGIRVKSITLHGAEATHQTVYDYTNNNRTSGVTSFEPGGLNQGLLNYPESGEPYARYFTDLIARQEAEKIYNKELFKNFSGVLKNAREIPPPGVLYEYVAVRGKIIRSNGEVLDVPNHSRYQFQVFDPSMMAVLYDDYKVYQFSTPLQSQPNVVNAHRTKSRTVRIKNFTSRVGALKRVILYHGDEKISETINHYLHDSNPQSGNDYENSIRLQFNGIGIIQETFAEGRFVKQKYNVTHDFGSFTGTGRAWHFLGVVSKREEYPFIQTGQTAINYKTGITTHTDNLALDFYTGGVLKTRSSDGYGNTFVSEITPAYRAYDAMKPQGLGGKNMLTQQAGSITYKLNPANLSQKQGLVAASVQTWSDAIKVIDAPSNKQQGIWRKHGLYIWKGDDVPSNPDGLYPFANFAAQPFNYANPSQSPAQWQKQSQITLYDVYTHGLEATDINNDFAATKMTAKGSGVLATVANANYDEFTYSGFESANDGAVTFTGASRSPETAHSGKTSVKLESTGEVKFHTDVARMQSGKKYMISYWVNSSDHANVKPYYRLNGAAAPVYLSNNDTESKKVIIPGKGTWYLHTTQFTFPAGAASFEIGCKGSTGYIDDFRVHPFDAAMTSYVYNEWGELTHIIDDNNLYTEYRYDNMGRLIETYREAFQSPSQMNSVVKLTEVAYNYGVESSFMINITSSRAGGPGNILPLGTQSVEQGKDITFEIQETCSNPKFYYLSVDGKKIEFDSNNKAVLFDGTQVHRIGKIFTLRNVQSAHIVQAVFSSQPVVGEVVCSSYVDNNGTTCYDGGYRYAYYNSCGELGPWQGVSKVEQIPSNLQSRIPTGNCCTYNEANSQCYCKPGGTVLID